MKTLKDVNKDIKEVKEQIKQAYGLPGEKKLRAELARLNEHKLYLETAPSEKYCKDAAQRLATTIDSIVDDVTHQIKLMEDQAKAKLKPSIKTDFLKDRGVPKLRQQLQQLNYLLS